MKRGGTMIEEERTEEDSPLILVFHNTNQVSYEL